MTAARHLLRAAATGSTKKPVYLMRKTDSKLMQLLSWLLKPVAPRFTSNFHTLLGHTIYVASKYDEDTDFGSVAWSARHAPTIAHELVHVRRMEKWTALPYAIAYAGPSPFLFATGGLLAGLALAGVVGWLPALVLLGLSLLCLPLTMGLAYGRWFIEREAYAVQVKYWRQRGVHADDIADWIAGTLWKNYLFTWPYSRMRAWVVRLANE